MAPGVRPETVGISLKQKELSDPIAASPTSMFVIVANLQYDEDLPRRWLFLSLLSS